MYLLQSAGTWLICVGISIFLGAYRFWTEGHGVNQGCNQQSNRPPPSSLQVDVLVLQCHPPGTEDSKRLQAPFISKISRLTPQQLPLSRSWSLLGDLFFVRRSKSVQISCASFRHRSFDHATFEQPPCLQLGQNAWLILNSASLASRMCDSNSSPSLEVARLASGTSMTRRWNGMQRPCNRYGMPLRTRGSKYIDVIGNVLLASAFHAISNCGAWALTIWVGLLFTEGFIDR